MLVNAIVVGIALVSPVRRPQTPRGDFAPAEKVQVPGQAWDARFHLNGAPGAAVLATYDDGSGPALFAGGGIVTVDDAPASRIARWNGQSWSALGAGLSVTGFGNPAQVMAMTVFDGGTGAELYVGGFFSRAGSVTVNGIARWNGKRWAGVGTAGSGFVRVQALTVFDDGHGPALYAGGYFSSIGGTAARGIAKWNGTSWTPLGGGVTSYFGDPGNVESLAGFHGKLYAGGEFISVDGLPVQNIASWDGAHWAALGGGAVQQFSTLSHVHALEVCKDERGQFLALGGEFSHLDGKPARNVGRWNGSRFEPIGDGLSFSTVQTLAQFDDGHGSALYAGGDFFILPGGPRVSTARWDGHAWTPVGDDLEWEQGTGFVTDFQVFDPGSGKTLFAAGGFTFSGERVVEGLAELRNGEWFPPSTRGQGTEVGINASDTTPISALEVFDDASGEELFAAGNFNRAGTTAADKIAKWNGERWAPLGEGIFGSSVDRVLALEVFDDGNGPSLYAAGVFLGAGSVAASSIARWDGVAWWPVGTGIGQVLGGFREVYALQVFDDGSGPALYVGGAFSEAGGVSVHSLAKWDGTSWSDVGGGVTEFQVGQVHALAVYDDGSGPALYAGGRFDAAGGTTAHGIAKWNGTSWSDVGGGFEEFSSTVYALATFDDGTGEKLYAGGQFFSAGGASARNLACWDGTSWTAIGLNSRVYSFAVHDDGTRPALYVGGEFSRTIPGNQSLLRVGRWDGTAWSALSTGIDGTRLPRVEALCSFSPDGVPALYLGGNFDTAGGLRSSNVARWFDSTHRRSP